MPTPSPAAPNPAPPTSATLDFSPLTNPTVDDPQLSDLGRRLASFAHANGGELYLIAQAQPLPGVIFRDEGDRPRPSQMAGNIVRFAGPPMIEVGNAMYMQAHHVTVLTRSARRWGYAALQLQASLPPLLLESARAHAELALPTATDASSPTLAGSHGQFTLTAPPESAALAREMLTPAVLDALDDGARGFDLEVSGGWLFLYSPGELSTADPATWQRTFGALDALRQSPALSH